MTHGRIVADRSKVTFPTDNLVGTGTHPYQSDATAGVGFDWHSGYRKPGTGGGTYDPYPSLQANYGYEGHSRQRVPTDGHGAMVSRAAVEVPPIIVPIGMLLLAAVLLWKSK